MNDYEKILALCATVLDSGIYSDRLRIALQGNALTVYEFTELIRILLQKSK